MGSPINQDVTDPSANWITDPSWIEAWPHKEWDIQGKDHPLPDTMFFSTISFMQGFVGP